MTGERARRVAVRESLAFDSGPAYADAFEFRLAQRDDRTAEEWVRAGLEGAPALVRWLVPFVHRHVLRLRLGPPGDRDHVMGWRIAAAAPDVVRLEASGSLADAVIVGRRVDPTCTSLTTALRYRKPAPARTVWAFVGPLHRRIAPLLLQRAARQTPTATARLPR
jgi:hypothetical protein